MNEEIDSTAQRDIVIQRFSETEECMVNLVNEKRLPSRERSHIPLLGFVGRFRLRLVGYPMIFCTPLKTSMSPKKGLFQ